MALSKVAPMTPTARTKSGDSGKEGNPTHEKTQDQRSIQNPSPGILLSRIAKHPKKQHLPASGFRWMGKRGSKPEKARRPRPSNRRCFGPRRQRVTHTQVTDSRKATKATSLMPRTTCITLCIQRRLRVSSFQFTFGTLHKKASTNPQAQNPWQQVQRAVVEMLQSTVIQQKGFPKTQAQNPWQQVQSRTDTPITPPPRPGQK